jgi:PAS domain S-box-containing protein
MTGAAPTTAMVAADRAGSITLWDDGAVAFLGHSREHALGRNVAFIVPEEYRDRHRAGLQRVMGGGAVPAGGEPFHLPALLADGSVKVFAVRFVYLVAARGNAVGAMVIFEAADPGAAPWTAVLPT